VIDSGHVLLEIAKNQFLEKFVAPEAIMRDLRAASGRLAVDSDAASANNDTSASDDGVRREVESTLREASWRATYLVTKRRRKTLGHSVPPAWHRSVVEALSGALTEASSAGVPYACGTHLLLGLLADSSGPARVASRNAGLQPGALTRALREASGQFAGEPFAPLVAMLEASGSVGQSSGVVRLLVQVVNRIQSKRGGYGNSVLFTFENEILRQAVRAGAPMVTTAHALLAMVSLDMQLMAKGRFLRPSLARVNTAGAMLRQNGVSLPCPVGYLDGLSMEGDVLTPDETRQRFGGYGGPPWGRYVTGALDRVALIARETHEECGTNHLLIELLNDEDSAASHLVRSFGADSSEIRRHIQGMF
jgi:hypothetical protein